MDSHNRENSIKKYDEKSLEKLQSRLVFNDPAYLFVFKKTEKIIAALYLITNLISDNEPIKWQIRKVSVNLVSDMLALKRLSSVQARSLIVGVITSISEIISLLKVALISNQVSTMNYSIVQRELTLLISNLESINPEVVGNGGVILPQDFFDVPVMAPAVANTQTFSVKGQYRTPNVIKDNQTQSIPKDSLKDSRRENILKLLKVGKPLGIKDFVREIKDCSEKTIQRELLAMVENGVLKKSGERRWSLYSLV